MKIWFYAKGGDHFGPFTDDELKGLAAAGTLKRTDLIWKDGLDDWVPADAEQGLFSGLPPAIPPPIPRRGAAPAQQAARMAAKPTAHPVWQPQPDSPVRLVLIAGTICAALLCLFLWGSRGGGTHPKTAAPLPAAYPPLQGADALREANRCYAGDDLHCAENYLRAYLVSAPQDAHSMALLGVTLNRLGQHAQAVQQFEAALNLGWATYDTFAYYALSLAALGRTDDSIKWNYRALATVPNLVDVSGTLAQQLTQQGHADEALALLTAFDDEMAAKGQNAYFMAQRIVIEDKIEQQRRADPGAKTIFEVANLEGHFSVPVKLGEAHYAAFIVDTGATTTLVSNKLLASSKAKYAMLNRDASGMLADGRTVKGAFVRLDEVLVGTVALKDLDAFACDTCGLLLGQSALKHFDLHSARSAGVEFLTLTER